jgi:cardiolipin-specific phospholipase
MGIPKLVLAGHSFGGYLAAMYAVKYPQNLTELILLSPAGGTKYSQ